MLPVTQGARFWPRRLSPSGIFQKRLIRERLQELDQVGLLSSRDFEAPHELALIRTVGPAASRVMFDYFRQRGDASVVHVRRGDPYVTQRGRPKPADIAPVERVLVEAGIVELVGS